MTKSFSLVAVLIISIYSQNGLTDERFTQSTLQINRVTLQISIADTLEKRLIGLSKHQSLPTNHAMLFAYTKSRQRGFTMKDTAIPLSIAFINRHLLITQIIKMQPLDKKTYQSKQAFLYALEVNQGWFEEKQIKAGDSVKFTLDKK